MILAVMDDLLFRSKLEVAAQQAGAELVFASNVTAEMSTISRGAETPHRVLIDLNLSRGNVLEMVRDLRAAYADVEIVGYCSHIQQELQKEALAAGCTTVLPRSAFVQRLGELLGEN